MASSYPNPPFLNPIPASHSLTGYPNYVLTVLATRNGLSREAIHALKGEVTRGDSYWEILHNLEAKLTTMQIVVDKGVIWDYAVQQWKADKRNVYLDRTPGYAEAKQRYQTSRTLWVSDFWRFYNLGLSGTVTDEQAVQHTRACLQLANSLINHPQYGNPEWAITWRQLLTNLYRPERVNSVETARVFTWLLHNATRRGLKARKLSDISREWGWNPISTNRLVELVRHCGGTADSNLDPALEP